MIPKDNFDSGNWALHHRDEIIATWFIPLEDPLGMAQAWAGPLYQALTQDQVDQLKSMEGQSVLQPLNEQAVTDMPPNEDGFYELSPDERNWSNKGVLRTSIMLHQVSGNFVTRASIDAAYAVAERCTTGRYNVEDVARIVVGFSPASETIQSFVEEAVEAGVGDITVAEVAVPLHVLGHPPDDLSVELAEAASQPHAAGLPEPQGWLPFIAESELSPSDYRQAVAQRALSALHLAISELRELQKSYHVATRSPIPLITYERMPPIIPVAFRALGEIGTPGAAVMNLVPVHRNLWAWLAPAELGASEYELVNESIRRGTLLPYRSYLDLRREAHVALERNGDTRAAAIYAGLSAEVLLDELLQQLMWEEALRPEEAVTQWKGGLNSRVKLEFHKRLGGSWDVSADSPVGRWATRCADLRHRAVHGAYLPSYVEARASLDALEGLLEYLCDRLCMPGQLRRYPRTALTLPGRSGLQQRSQYSAKLRALQADPREPNWDGTFARWRESFRRIRRDADTPRKPELQHSELIAIACPDGRKYLSVVDSSCGLAVEVEEGPTAGSNAGLQKALQQVAGIDTSKLVEPYSIGCRAFQGSDVKLLGDWVESYHLIPLASVMVDKTDLTAN